MASTSVSTLGGVVVITQVIRKDEASIPLQSAATLQAPPPPMKTPPSSEKMDSMTTTFLQGGPQALGVVQMSIGLMCVLFSLTAAYSPVLIAYAPLGLAAAFVVSGALAVAAGGRPSVELVWASLLSSTVGGLIGVAGATYVCWLLAEGLPSDLLCDLQSLGELTNPEQGRMECREKLWQLDRLLYGLLGLLLVLLVLQVCVSITVCVFSGRAIRRRSRYSSVTEEGDDDSAAP
ncbi:membrane-spanning 4-domains subfamily A member 4A [Parambassis ranga]|uniref:Membrane-spanning 4-domains subfamily A member 4A n=1 Tax=Parambassis ranga TaxID=210632 RepID=A0A6P7HGL9_9TELE|nr:membrane-spanning 4-domains subfamily A member 4A [Parambassis ranga]XP_028254730.1 membrane-spanning 4-domains subfamily A member 4A [Parambassis ranga]